MTDQPLFQQKRQNFFFRTKKLCLTLSCLKTVVKDFKKDYDRPDVISAKKAELEKFFKFNVIKSVPRAPRHAEVMRTTWVITEKSDNMSKTGSKVMARLCTLGNSAKEFSKDSVQFESPTCGRDTVKAILSLVPDNKWNIGTFDVSSAFFQGTLYKERFMSRTQRAPASGS